MHRSIRWAASTTIVLLALTIGFQPAAASVTVHQWGTYGSYEIDDQSGGPYGANCLYESGSHDLNKITVRPPQNVHGNYSNYTKVEWRFKVQRDAMYSANWALIYTSSWQSDTANDQLPANGFSRRPWVAGENPSGRFRVLIEIRWWHNGSVEGSVRERLQWYKQKGSMSTFEGMGYCNPNYP